MSRQNGKSAQPRRRRMWFRVEQEQFENLQLMKQSTGLSINTIITNGVDLEISRLLKKSKRSARGASSVAQ